MAQKATVTICTILWLLSKLKMSLSVLCLCCLQIYIKVRSVCFLLMFGSVEGNYLLQPSPSPSPCLKWRESFHSGTLDQMRAFPGKAKSAISIFFSAHLCNSEAAWIAYRRSEGRRQAFPLQPSKHSPFLEGHQQFPCSGPLLKGVRQRVTLDRRQRNTWASGAIRINRQLY